MPCQGGDRGLVGRVRVYRPEGLRSVCIHVLRRRGGCALVCRRLRPRFARCRRAPNFWAGQGGLQASEHVRQRRTYLAQPVPQSLSRGQAGTFGNGNRRRKRVCLFRSRRACRPDFFTYGRQERPHHRGGRNGANGGQTFQGPWRWNAVHSEQDVLFRKGARRRVGGRSLDASRNSRRIARGRRCPFGRQRGWLSH